MQCTKSVLRLNRSVGSLWPRFAAWTSDGRNIRFLTASATAPNLRSVLEALLQACTPSKEDADRRWQLIADVQKSLDKLHTQGELRTNPFGSFVSSLYDARSDLDLVVCGELPLKQTKDKHLNRVLEEGQLVPLIKMKRVDQIRLMHSAGQQLVADGVAVREGLEVRAAARVPILTFQSSPRHGGLHVDMSLADEAVPFKAWSVGQLVRVHPAFERLYRVVKVWASAQTINDGAAHMFNSWCLNLLVLFYLQRHHHPPLLPPVRALLQDVQGPPLPERLMQQGSQPTAAQLARAREAFQHNAAAARDTYGHLPAPPLEELFADFLESTAHVLQRALRRAGPFTKGGTGVSIWHGDYRPFRPLNKKAHFYVEDPYDSTDNTARTFRKTANMRKETTLHFVASVFARSARRLGRKVPHFVDPTIKGTAIATKPQPPSPSSTTAVSGPTAPPSYDPASPSASCTDPSLAPTLVFLFGTELLTRLPVLAESLLGQPLFEWARAALAAGRPAWEVHEALLKQMGATDDFESFRAFRRRNEVHILNELKYATPEELALVQPLLAAHNAGQGLSAAQSHILKTFTRGGDVLAAAASSQDGKPEEDSDNENDKEEKEDGEEEEEEEAPKRRRPPPPARKARDPKRGPSKPEAQASDSATSEPILEKPRNRKPSSADGDVGSSSGGGNGSGSGGGTRPGGSKARGGGGGGGGEGGKSSKGSGSGTGWKGPTRDRGGQQDRRTSDRGGGGGGGDGGGGDSARRHQRPNNPQLSALAKALVRPQEPAAEGGGGPGREGGAAGAQKVAGRGTAGAA